MGNGEMKLNRYPKYKPTGIAWLPEVPEGWEVRRFRTLYGFGKGLPITKADLKETGIPVISYGQIHAKTNTGVTLDRALLRYVSEEYLTSLPKCLLQLGDMAIADTSEDLEGCGNAVLMDCKEPVFAGYHTIIARIRDRRHDKYLAYVFRSQPWRELVRHLVHGVKVFSVTKQVLSATSFPIPPLPTQRAIVAFLDGKCGKVDRLVAAKEREVALLKELKQAMIAEAVTGATHVARTDTARKMKPSGIPWLPEVPEGWEVRRLKGLFSLRRESYSPNEQLQVLSLIKDVGVIPYDEKGQLGNKSKEDISGYNVARKGDIVMNSMNVIIGSVDITPFDGYISPAYYALTARQGVEPKYFESCGKSEKAFLTAA